MEELGEGDEFRVTYFFFFEQLSVLFTYNKVSSKNLYRLLEMLRPSLNFFQFFTIKTVSRKERLDVIFSHSLDVPDCFVVVGRCLMNMFNAFFCEKGIVHYTTKCVVFFSLKILDSKEQDVASSTIAQEGEDTQTMDVAVEGEIPADGEGITLSYFVQALKCVKQQLSTDLSS